MNLIEITQFCSAKDTIKKVKSQRLGKIFKNHTSNKTYMHNTQGTLKTRKQPYKIGKDFNGYFTREDKQKIGT